MSKSLSALDIAFFAIESNANPAHIAVLQIFELPADADHSSYFKTLIAKLKGRTSAEPPFNQRLSFGLSGRPQWVTEDRVNLEYHLSHSALPRPGGMDELLDFVGHLHGRKMDRSQPLWEMHVIEGLLGNRFACYTKIHHALIDGMAGMKRIENALDTDSSAEVKVLWQQGRSAAVGDGPRPTKEPKAWAMGPWKNVRAGVDLALELGGLVGRMGSKMLGTSRSTAPAPFTAPKSALNCKVSARRKLSVLTLRLSEIKQIGAAAGATVNDIVLAICADGLRKFMRKRGTLPDADMLALMPVSISRQGTGKPGNNLSYIFVNLATSVADPVERMRIIRSSTTDAKAEVAEMSTAGAIAFAAAAQGMTAAIKSLRLTEVLPPPANLVISNVAGPRMPLYMMGARLVAVFPISAIIDGQALNITVTSHGDSLDFGLTACHDALPDLDHLSNLLGRAHELLRQRYLGAPKRKPAAANSLPGATPERSNQERTRPARRPQGT